jgi:hypothetical protein
VISIGCQAETVVGLSLGCGQSSVGGEVANRVTINYRVIAETVAHRGILPYVTSLPLNYATAPFHS